MSGKSLRRLLSIDYESLARRLSRSLGSANLVREALREKLLRAECIGGAAPRRNPADYLGRTGINVVKDQHKRDGNLLSAAEIDSICAFSEEGPDPSTVIDARLELEKLGQALSELPKRCRALFLVAHVHQISHSDIATRFGINARTVEFDLRYALEHLSHRLRRKVI